MIRYVIVAGVLVSGLSSALADDRLIWPQSDAFYKGQIDQKYRTIEQPPAVVPGVPPTVSPSASVGYVPTQPYQQIPPYYGQNPSYAGGGYYPSAPVASYPSYAPSVNHPQNYMPSMGNMPYMNGMPSMGNMPSMPSMGNSGLPFGMNNMNGFVPPVPTSFSFPNPANAVNGMSFPGFPSFGNNMFSPFGR